MEHLTYSNFIIVINDNKFGCLSKDGEEIAELKYEDIAELYGDLIALKLNGKWGILNTKNEVIQPFKYDSILTVNDDEAEAKLDGKTFRIDYKGVATPK